MAFCWLFLRPFLTLVNTCDEVRQEGNKEQDGWVTPPSPHTHSHYGLTSVDPLALQQPHIPLTGVKWGFACGVFYDTEREEEWLHCNILGHKQCGDSKMFCGSKKHTIPHLCFVCLQRKPDDRSRCYCFGLSPNTPAFITSFSLHNHVLTKMIICFLSPSAVDGIQ